MSRRTCPEKTYCGKNSLLFRSTSGFELIFCDLVSEAFKSGCQNCNLRVHNNFLRKHILFRKNIVFSPLSEFRRKSLDLLRKFSGRFVIIVFAVSSGKVWRKTLFHHVQKWDEIFFDFWRKNSGSVVETALYVSGGNFCGLFSLHSSFLKQFWILAKSSWQVFKVAFSMSAGTSLRKCFFSGKKRIFSASLAEFGQKNLQVRQKFLDRIVEIAF